MFRWFTEDRADTDGPSHPDLSPLVLPLSVADAAGLLRVAVGGLPNWRVEAGDDAGLHLVCRMWTFGFKDDVRLRFLPAGPGTLIHAESRSRVRLGDLGRNRRNILHLWAAIRGLT
jgi:uncharacterized protein (DUF1499 family)